MQNLAQQNLDDIAVVVVAAGSGSRAGGALPKQYRILAGMPLLARTLKLFCKAGFGRIVPVIGAGQEPDFAKVLEALTAAERNCVMAPVIGAETRQASVLNGLTALRSAAPTYVLIHDGARALTPPALICAIIDELRHEPNLIPALEIVETVKKIEASGAIVATIERGSLRAAQTPQAFRFSDIFSAHQHAAAQAIQGLTDDASLLEWAGQKVRVVEGAAENIKITHSADFLIAERMIMNSLNDIRVGHGYDVHSFEPGDHVWLGGVKIPHKAKLNGHSDADVLLHALTDAILGALGDGDIGVHFPPSEEKWRGAASSVFLQDAVRRVQARGGMIAHLDGTLICEAPKIGPHREAMRARIAEIAGLSLDRVGLKATTSEKIGFVGREEGIVAYGVATVRLP